MLPTFPSSPKFDSFQVSSFQVPISHDFRRIHQFRYVCHGVPPFSAALGDSIPMYSVVNNSLLFDEYVHTITVVLQLYDFVLFFLLQRHL
jgi:hypothetical protein